MKLNTLLTTVAVATVASAQKPVSYSATDSISYEISVPSSTAQSGSGDFFFRMSGPVANQWIAMGVGSNEMKGAQIFIMYQDGAGNVTVSPRLGVGNVEPKVNPAATLELLGGSGIMNGMMVANVRCMDCSSWGSGSTAGTIDYTSSSADFIWAHRMGSSLASTDKQEDIEQHQNDGKPFTIDFTQATGGSDSASANPFLTAAGAPASGSDTGSTSEMGSEPPNVIIMAHGIIMGLVVVVLLPLGALAMRLLPTPWWVHGALQMTFLLLLTAGFGLGYYWADNTEALYMGDSYTHTVFGTVLFSFFWLQPFLGYAHHLLYKKKGKRGVVSHVHIWWGRAVMIMAIVNGGLGLKLADNTKGGEIAYGVVAGLIFIVYVAGAVYGEMKLRSNHTHHGEK